MPTPKIQFESGHFYHAWTHANGLDNLFREEANYLFLLSKYASYIHPVAKTFAYCLMPNHFHLMIQIREGMVNSPSQAFSNLLNSYTQAFNKKYQRKGSLLSPISIEEKSKAIPISRDALPTSIKIHLIMDLSKISGIGNSAHGNLISQQHPRNLKNRQF